MKRFFNFTMLLGILALTLLASCDDDQSYADRLNEERNAVNAYLANHRVVMSVPEDSVFEVGENAPFYRVDVDGNVYMQQKPKRVHNKPLFRDDNASLSHGRNGRWYFYFSLDEDQIGELPEQLVRQASAIAQKVLRELICNR